MPADGNTETVIKAAIKIKYAKRQEIEEDSFVLGTNTEKIELEGEETGVLWYVGNSLREDNRLHSSDGNLKFSEDTWHDVLAVKTTEEGKR